MTYPSETVTATPSDPIVTLDELKRVMRKSGTSEDDELGLYLNAATNTITQLCLPLQQFSVIDTFDGDGYGTVLVLGLFPVQTVTSVLVYDFAGVSSPIVEAGGASGLAAGYRVDKIAGVVRLVGAGPWPDGYGNVVVTYTVGPVVAPDDVIAAVIDLAQHFWRYRIIPSSSGQANQSDPQGYQPSIDIPQSVVGLLRPYLKPPRVA